MWEELNRDNVTHQHLTDIALLAQRSGDAYASFTVAHLEFFMRTRNQATLLKYTRPQQQIAMVLAHEPYGWRMHNALLGGQINRSLLQIGMRRLRQWADDNGIETWTTKVFIGRNDYTPEVEAGYLAAVEMYHELDHDEWRDVRDYSDGQCEFWKYKRVESRKPFDEQWIGRTDVDAIRAELQARRDAILALRVPDAGGTP